MLRKRMQFKSRFKNQLEKNILTSYVCRVGSGSKIEYHRTIPRIVAWKNKFDFYVVQHTNKSLSRCKTEVHVLILIHKKCL